MKKNLKRFLSAFLASLMILPMIGSDGENFHSHAEETAGDDTEIYEEIKVFGISRTIGYLKSHSSKDIYLQLEETTWPARYGEGVYLTDVIPLPFSNDIDIELVDVDSWTEDNFKFGRDLRYNKIKDENYPNHYFYSFPIYLEDIQNFKDNYTMMIGETKYKEGNDKDIYGRPVYKPPVLRKGSNGEWEVEVSYYLQLDKETQFDYVNELRTGYIDLNKLSGLFGHNIGGTGVNSSANDKTYSNMLNWMTTLIKGPPRSLENLKDETGFMWISPRVVTVKRSAKVQTFVRHFTEDGIALKEYDYEHYHKKDQPKDFPMAEIPNYTFVGSIQKYETQPSIKTDTLSDKKSYTVTWTDENQFTRNYVYYYFKENLEAPPGDITAPPDSYKSIPKAYGEIKNNKWTADRSSEEWNAMAGIPHTENLYIDIGASGVAVDVHRSESTTTVTGPSSHTVTNHATHRDLRQCSECGGSYCHACESPSHQFCPMDRQWNDKYDKDGNVIGGYWSGCDCGKWHRKCSSDPVTYKQQWSVPRYSVAAFTVGDYDVKYPNVSETVAPYIGHNASNPLKMTASASPEVYKVPASLELRGLSGSAPGSYLCMEEERHKKDAEDMIAKEFPNSRLVYTSNMFMVQDGGGNYYHFLYDKDVSFFSSGSGNTRSLQYKPSVNTAGDGVLDLKLWEIVPHSEMQRLKTNFMPTADNWSEEFKMKIIGYNGDFASSARRSSLKGLFYKEGLKFTDIYNGVKKTGDSFVKYESSKISGSSAVANNLAKAVYYEGAEGINNVLVHTPIAISEVSVKEKDPLSDQRINSQYSVIDRITPDRDFTMTVDTKWYIDNSEKRKAIGDVTPYLGPGFYKGRETKEWIAVKWAEFPVDVVAKWNNVRYKAGEKVYLSPNQYWYEFHLPVSEPELDKSIISVYARATNFDMIPEDAKNWDAINNVRYGGKDEYKADSTINKWKTTDIVGRIGNFAVTYTTDRIFEDFFAKPDVSKPIIKGLLYEPLKPLQPNKYVGPLKTMFNENTNGNPLGLDRFGSISSLRKPPSGYHPVSGKMLSHKAFETNRIKLGYPAYFSLQTVGNYDTPESRVEMYPRFTIYDKTTGEKTEVGSIWVKDGLIHKRVWDKDSAAAIKNGTKAFEKNKLIDMAVKVNMPHTFVDNVERQRTNLVDNSALAVTTNTPIGNINKITLTKDTRTFIGGFYSLNMDWNKGTYAEDVPGTDKKHAKQAQRWHGKIWLPSSAQFSVKTGNGAEKIVDGKDFLNTKNKELYIDFDVYVKNGNNPWTLTNTFDYASGAKKNDYSVIFDLDERSSDDMTISGTH